MARATRPLMVRPPIQEEFVDLGVNPFAASTGLEGLELTDEVVDAIVGNLLRDRDSDSAIRINGRSYDDTSGDMMEYLLGRVGNVRSKEAPIFTTIGERCLHNRRYPRESSYSCTCYNSRDCY